MSAPLDDVNTLGVAATADRLLAVDSERVLQDLVRERLRAAAAVREPLTVLGGGSNVVLRDRVPGVVALMRMRGYRLERQGRGTAHVTAAAGERWHDLVRRTLGGGWAGLENLALIPGSVGAAPIQNIGAYGVELADRFVRLRALDPDSGQVRQFDRAACGFGYRDSIFKSGEGEGLIVLDLTVSLTRRGAAKIDYPDLRVELERLGWAKPTPIQVAEAVIRIRRRKLPDPRFLGNVGSFFKNPVVAGSAADALRRQLPGLALRPAGSGMVKLSAAQLIDACGWKGRRTGAVAVWLRQPLVLCNHGGARGRDVLALSDEIRRDVWKRFRVDLVLEPRVVGEDDPAAH